MREIEREFWHMKKTAIDRASLNKLNKTHLVPIMDDVVKSRYISNFRYIIEQQGAWGVSHAACSDNYE